MRTHWPGRALIQREAKVAGQSVRLRSLKKLLDEQRRCGRMRGLDISKSGVLLQGFYAIVTLAR